MRKFLLIIILLTPVLSAQKLYKVNVLVGSTPKQISAIHSGYLKYLSVDELAREFDINYYKSTPKRKIELKSKDKRLKITGKNPFLVLSSTETNKAKIYQMPVETIIYKEGIFIPINFSIDILERFFGAPVNITRGDGNTLLAETYDIRDISISDKANGTLITINTSKKLGTVKHNLTGNTLTITVEGMTADCSRLSSLKTEGLVKNIECSEGTGSTVIKLNMLKDFSNYDLISDKELKSIFITVYKKSFAENQSDTKKQKWDFDVIVLDAGHGGKDPGAVGHGVREKDIVLNIVKKLGALIEKNMKDVKVVYTRASDKFVELHQRGKIANERGGKLFISVHCNATPHKNGSIRGYEFYLLRPGRTQEAIEIAEMENSVIKYEENPDRYQQLTDENFILVSMAHSSYMQYSEKFAEMLDKYFEVHTPLRPRGVKQAGFYVLVGASMPSVLVETGFINNKKDAAYLNSSKGQQEVAFSIFQAIKAFKDYYEAVIKTE